MWMKLDLDKDWDNPRKVAEPNLNKLLETYYGDISFWVDVKDGTGNIVSEEEVKLQDFGLEVIDLLYMQDSELKIRLHYYGKTKYPNKSFDIRFDKKTPSDTNKKSLPELKFLIRSLQEMVGQGQALKSSDFTFSQYDLANYDSDTIKKIFQRFYDTLAFAC